MNLKICFQTLETSILSLLVEYFTIKTDIIRYILLPKSTWLKLCNQPYVYVVYRKKNAYIYIRIHTDIK